MYFNKYKLIKRLFRNRTASIYLCRVTTTSELFEQNIEIVVKYYHDPKTYYHTGERHKEIINISHHIHGMCTI